MSDVLANQIRSAGYWETVIRPVSYVPTRIKPISKLFPIVERSSVQLRGWDFPHVDTREPSAPGQDSVSQRVSWEHFREIWRFYQSGQFVSLRALPSDWRQHSRLWPPPNDRWQPGVEQPLIDSLITIVEIFEFAARLANSEAGDRTMVISVRVGGLKGRTLVMDGLRRGPFSWTQPAQISVLDLTTHTIERERLMADPLEPAFVCASDLYARFGREFSRETMKDWLKDLRRR